MSKKMISIGWCIILSGIALSQNNNPQSDTVILNEVVISASKIPLDRKETAKQVQTITAEEIKRSEGKDLAQVLNRQSGIVIAGTYSNPGKNKEVFVRGSTSEYTLVLIDGIPVSDASSFGGVFDLRLIPLHLVERIEILKGSQSTLYGSDAIAGIINIITKTPDSKPVSLHGSLSYGSLENLETSIGVSGTTGVLGYDLLYSRVSNEGLSDALDNVDSVEFDKDGMERNSFQASLQFRPGDNIKITPFIRFTDFKGDFDAGAFADAPNTFDSEMLNPGVRLIYAQNGLGLTGLYNYIQSNRLFNSTFGESIFEGQTHNADLFASYEFNPTLQLVGGIYLQQARMLDDQGTMMNPSFNTLSPYLTFLIKGWHNLNAELGYRLNNHSEFGSHSTYSVALSYFIMPTLSVYSSLTSGFKSPNLNQLFGQFGPNPDLDPQTSITYEAGLEIRLLENDLNVQLTYFDRLIDEVITFDFSTGYQNQNEQNDYGFEADLRYRLSDKVSFTGNYSFVDGAVTLPVTADRDTTFFNLIRRPKHSFRMGLDLELIENFFFSIDGQYYGDRSDIFFNSVTFQSEPTQLDAYFLLNLYSEYRVMNERLSFFADVKNLTDTDFTESTGFTTLGINLQTGLKFRF